MESYCYSSLTYDSSNRRNEIVTICVCLLPLVKDQLLYRLRIIWQGQQDLRDLYAIIFSLSLLAYVFMCYIPVTAACLKGFLDFMYCLVWPYLLLLICCSFYLIVDPFFHCVVWHSLLELEDHLYRTYYWSFLFQF